MQSKRCGLLLPMFRALRLCICLSVGHNREPHKTDSGAFWDMDSGEPPKPCIRWGPGSPRARGTLRNLPVHCKCIGNIVRAVDILNFIRSMAAAMRPFAVTAAATCYSACPQHYECTHTGILRERLLLSPTPSLKHSVAEHPVASCSLV